MLKLSNGESNRLDECQNLISDQILIHQFLEPILLKLTHQCDVVS